MTDELTKQFKKLWKVGIIESLLKFADKETKITRDEIDSLERDLHFIKYGFEEGMKLK